MDKVKPTVNGNETWVNTKWRPAMGWTYILICLFDFVIAPILNYVFFAKTGVDFVSWKPLTMSDGGLFHISMGAVLGVVAYTRGKEKLKRYDVYEEPEDRASHRDRIASNSFRED
jgi:hypothetical protein